MALRITIAIIIIIIVVVVEEEEAGRIVSTPGKMFSGFLSCFYIILS